VAVGVVVASVYGCAVVMPENAGAGTLVWVRPKVNLNKLASFATLNQTQESLPSF
jgi:hypothetical protein